MAQRAALARALVNDPKIAAKGSMRSVFAPPPKVRDGSRPPRPLRDGWLHARNAVLAR
jgi:hypothetical protein